MNLKLSTFGLLSGALLAGSATPIVAQTATEDTQDTAKPADTVSPYGVSYHTGSFTYSVPLFTIGYGEWPNQITVTLDYDSSGARQPNSPWTLGINRRISASYARYATGFEGDPLTDEHEYAVNLVLGNGKASFNLGDYTLNPANFESASIDGSSIDFTLGSPGNHGGATYGKHGTFVITGRDGTTSEFTGGLLHAFDGPLRISSGVKTTLPNGVIIQYTQPNSLSGTASPLPFSNGLYVKWEGNQICAFNGAFVDLSTNPPCSSAPLVATITTASFPSSGVNAQLITSVTRPDGGTYQFQYQQYTTTSWLASENAFGGTRTRSHLSCVKEPGQSVCAVQNTYDPCDGSGFVFTNQDFFGQGSWGPYDSEWTGARDRVSSQTLADGRTISYSYTGGIVGPTSPGPCDDVRSVNMTESGAVTRVELEQRPTGKSSSPGADLVEDPLGRQTKYTWTGANNAAGSSRQTDKLASVELPDGQRLEYTYDARGNRIQTRRKAKPGSSLADIVTSASFPSSCSNPKTCNQPTSTTDANGNVTTYTYEGAHGGVRSMVSPAVGGVSPATRYYYVQREAWLKSGSGHAKSGDPIWLLSETRTCRTSALNLSNGTCAAGSGDLIRTVYDYGPDSGPNNLWLRGTAVIADGQTLRTCYTYDSLGRRLSETQPNANLSSCS